MVGTPDKYLRVCCCVCHAQAEKLVAKLDALGTTAGDLGLSLFKVAKFEVREAGDDVYTGLLCCSNCR